MPIALFTQADVDHGRAGESRSAPRVSPLLRAFAGPVLSATKVIHRLPVDETCVTAPAPTADARFVASQSTECA